MTTPIPALQDLKILLVEDSPDNQTLIKRVLMKHGASVVTADDGLQGAARALEENFDVVLMDIQMPVMDGYAAMARMRAGRCQAPVLALTAHAMDDERARTKAAGFAAHVVKPVEFRALIETIAGIAGRLKN